VFSPACLGVYLWLLTISFLRLQKLFVLTRDSLCALALKACRAHARHKILFLLSGQRIGWVRVADQTGARERLRGPDVISTPRVRGARHGARVEIMSVGSPRIAVRASRSGQDPFKSVSH
jgi:hypothetical protein